MKYVVIGAGFVTDACIKSLGQSGGQWSVIAGQILRSMMTPTGSAMLQRRLEHQGLEAGPRLVIDLGHTA